MAVEFSADAKSDSLQVNGTDAPEMLQRVSACLDNVCGRQRMRAAVASESNFPIGAGLASSASAFAALVVAASNAVAPPRSSAELARLAGQASGSAARSLFGGIVTLNAGESKIDVQQVSTPDEWPVEVIVAVTDEGQKSLGSGEAMIRSAGTSPFYSSWIERQGADFAMAKGAVEARD